MSVLCRAVQVVAEATGLHAAPVLHEVGFGAAATRVGARPSTGGTEAVTGLAVVAIEVLAVLAGDGALGPLQA